MLEYVVSRLCKLNALSTILFYPLSLPLIRTESACADFDCHDNGRCEVLYDGSAACVCDHSDISHDTTLAEQGYCALEVCTDTLTCSSGGDCV